MSAAHEIFAARSPGNFSIASEIYITENRDWSAGIVGNPKSAVEVARRFMWRNPDKKPKPKPNHDFPKERVGETTMRL